MSRSRANRMASRRAGSQQSGTALAQDGIEDFGFDFASFESAGIDMSGFDFTNDVEVGTTDMLPIGDHVNYWQSPSYDQLAQFHDAPLMIYPAYSMFDPTLVSQYSLGVATPGLTAYPGADAPTYNYPVSDMIGHPAGQPYYAPLPVHEQAGFTPMEQPFPEPTPVSHKRSRSLSHSEDEAQAPSPKRLHVSADEADKAPAKRASSFGSRKSKKKTSSSSSVPTLDEPTPAHAGEKPEKSEKKSWIRINTSTRGETTRTARINDEARKDLGYKYRPLPHGNLWRANSARYGQHTFEYSRSVSNMDELKKKKMSPRQIMAYITECKGLKLWIQVSPADSIRRYSSLGHNKCLFRDCPKHIWGDNGTIEVGHYQVAFDEKHKIHGGAFKAGNTIDPFDCVGFVHLYCLERFCDFELICQEADVEVDIREKSELPKEPGNVRFSMARRKELGAAQYFVKAAKKGKLRAKDFAQYPVHTSSSAPKEFSRTLLAKLSSISALHRTRSQMKQFATREPTSSNMLVSHGDLDLAMTKKKIAKTDAFKKAEKKKIYNRTTYPYRDFYDEYDPLINIRIKEVLKLRDQLIAEDATGTSRQSTKRKAKEVDEASEPEESEDEAVAGPSGTHYVLANDSDDSDDVQKVTSNPRSGTRSSPRKRQRISYNEDDDIEQPTQAPYQHHQYIDQGFTQANSIRKASMSALFTGVNVQGVPSLDDLDGAHEAPLNDEEFEALLGSLNRRKSSMLGPLRLGSIMSRRSSTRSPQKMGRVASFAPQPVTSAREFEVNDPPSQLVATPSTPSRRSSRLAKRSG